MVSIDDNKYEVAISMKIFKKNCLPGIWKELQGFKLIYEIMPVKLPEKKIRIQT